MVEGVDMSSWGVLYAHPYEQYFITQGCTYENVNRKKNDLSDSNSFLGSVVVGYTPNIRLTLVWLRNCHIKVLAKL